MKIGLLGCGTVGKSLLRILDETADLNVKYILDRNTIDDRRHIKDIDVILNDDEIDTVIEVIGGIDVAYEFITRSLRAKKNVVSANKAVIALYLDEFLRLAFENDVSFSFEASTGGAVPIIEEVLKMREMVDITDIEGIMNGTCNYILSKMEDEGLKFDDVLKEAQRLGLAERIPDTDIRGYDTQNKITILGSLLENRMIDVRDVMCYGIDGIDKCDYEYLKSHIRLIGHYSKNNIYVMPMVCNDIFGGIKGTLNLIRYHADNLDEMAMIGHGAGGDATATALLRDLRNPKYIKPLAKDKTEIINDDEYIFYLRLLKDINVEEDIIERYVDERYQYLKFRSSVNKMFNKYYKTAEFMAIWSRV